MPAFLAINTPVAESKAISPSISKSKSASVPAASIVKIEVEALALTNI